MKAPKCAFNGFPMGDALMNYATLLDDILELSFPILQKEHRYVLVFIFYIRLRREQLQRLSRATVS